MLELVKMSESQLAYLRPLVTKRRRQLGRSIAAADANRRAGVRIQSGVYERHINELHELAALGDELDEAAQRVQWRIRNRLKT